MDLSSLSKLASNGSLPTKKELLEFFKSLTPQQIADLDSLILSDPRPWLPLPGPQTKAARSLAEQLYYGGAAGGGKTDLIIGLSATEHYNSIIFRREFPQLRAIEDRVRGLFQPKYGNYARPVMHYKDSRQLELASMQYFEDREKYQGRPHDLKGFDEITHFLEGQYRYVIGWLRTTRPGVRTRVVAAGNPPINADGRWVIQYWAPWIDDKFPYPAEPGDLRWYIVDERSKDHLVDGPGEHTFKGEVYEAISRSFLPSRLRDNPYLNPSYRATLNSLPEPLRSQLLDGDFTAGLEDADYQLMPTAWVLAAQARWREGKEPRHLPVQQVGVDVARGGRDNAVISPRKGTWFCEQKVVPGVRATDGAAVATLVLQNVPARVLVAIDAIGVGSSPLDIMRGAGFKVLPIVGSQASIATDKSGMLGFVNLRAEIQWGFREALDPESGEELALPDDPELLSDLTAATFKVTARGIQVESKEDIKERIGRSPDKGDSIVYAHCHPALEGQGMLDWYQKTFDELQRQETAKRNSSPQH